MLRALAFHTLLRRGAVVWLAVLIGSAALAAQDPGQFMIDLDRRATAPFKDESLSDHDRVEVARRLVNETFDTAKIGKFVLGVNWRRATAEQRAEFLDVFAEVNLQRFLPLFTQYIDHSFTVEKVRQDERKAELFFVTSIITQGENPPVTVEWRLVREDGGYKILDVVAEGVSMVLTLRNEYASVIKTNGVDGLITQLRNKVKSGQTANSTQ